MLDARQIRDLDEIARAAKRSRASPIREAVAAYLGGKRAARAEDAFGLWGTRKIDELAYQQRLR